MTERHVEKHEFYLKYLVDFSVKTHCTDVQTRSQGERPASQERGELRCIAGEVHIVTDGITRLRCCHE